MASTLSLRTPTLVSMTPASIELMWQAGRRKNSHPIKARSCFFPEAFRLTARPFWSLQPKGRIPECRPAGCRHQAAEMDYRHAMGGASRRVFSRWHARDLGTQCRWHLDSESLRCLERQIPAHRHARGLDFAGRQPKRLFSRWQVPAAQSSEFTAAIRLLD